MHKNAITYWYDDLFKADAEYRIPTRVTTTIEDVERMWITEEKILNEPKTFVEAFRRTHLTEPAF